MPDGFDVASAEDRAELGAILSHCFGFPPGDARLWFDRASVENVYALRERGAVVGGLLFVPMGQFFGGASVPTMGVAGVGIAPEARGDGAATRLMVAALEAMRARGAAISTLYPATVPLYQRAGYERAGTRVVLTVSARTLPRVDPRDDPAGRLVVRRLVDAPDGALRAAQRAYAQRHHGALDRGDYVWRRVLAPYGAKAPPLALGLFDGDALRGHVVIEHRMGGENNEVVVTDVSAHDAAAARAVFGVLASYRSLADEVTIPTQFPSVLVAALHERHHGTSVPDMWMLRVLDVVAALGGRRYGVALRGDVELEVEDDVLPSVAGRYTLRVDGGVARVERGGAGRVKLTARALASAYTGFLPCSELVRAGLASGDDGSIAQMDAIFAGTPSVAEMF